MITIVLILNMLIAGLCWYGVWRIWQLRRTLVRVTATLTLVEQDANRVLSEAMDAVRQGQTGTAQVRLQYQQALRRFQQVQQVLALLGLGRLAWQQYEQRFRKPSTPKSFVKDLNQHPFREPSRRSNL